MLSPVAGFGLAATGLGFVFGFGFTGAHYHMNWGDENFRKRHPGLVRPDGSKRVPHHWLVTRPVSAMEIVLVADVV